MNIFYVERDPHEAAKALVDKHVVKMILESAQLLSTAHRVIDGIEYIDSSSGRKIKRWKLPDDREQILYKATHVNHPSAVWCRQSVPNYLWLFEHLMGLCEEYTYRYNKQHKCYGMLTATLGSPPYNLKSQEFTEPPPAMPVEHIVENNSLQSYRNYYSKGKEALHNWKRRDPPDWI